MSNNMSRGTKTALVKLQMLLNENDVELVYPVKTLYKFLVEELEGSDKKQCFNQARKKLTPMDYMFADFKNEVSPDGDFARDYISDSEAPRDAMAFLQYLVDYVDSEEAVKSYFNIVQRTMDDNANYSVERNSNKDLTAEVSDYLDDEIADELMR